MNKARFEAFSDGVYARSGAFASHVSAARILQTIVAYRTGWATYAVATLVATVAPAVSVALYVLIALYYLVPRGVDTDLPEGQTTA